MLPLGWAGIWASFVPDGFLAMLDDGFGVEISKETAGETLLLRLSSGELSGAVRSLGSLSRAVSFSRVADEKASRNKQIIQYYSACNNR
jgi:hypothetical protein